jgi:hypothetical protein
VNQIVLLTALTAASGLFGGGRQCSTGNCGGSWTYAAPTMAQVQAPLAAPLPTAYSSGYAGYAPGTYAYPAPAAYAPPAPAPAAYYVPQAPRMAYAPSPYFYPAPACATGSCPRR